MASLRNVASASSAEWSKGSTASDGVARRFAPGSFVSRGDGCSRRTEKNATTATTATTINDATAIQTGDRRPGAAACTSPESSYFFNSSISLRMSFAVW